MISSRERSVRGYQRERGRKEEARRTSPEGKTWRNGILDSGSW